MPRQQPVGVGHITGCLLLSSRYLQLGEVQVGPGPDTSACVASAAAESRRILAGSSGRCAACMQRSRSARLILFATAATELFSLAIVLQLATVQQLHLL